MDNVLSDDKIDFSKIFLKSRFLAKKKQFDKVKTQYVQNAPTAW